MMLPPAPEKYDRNTWQKILEQLRIQDERNIKRDAVQFPHLVRFTSAITPSQITSDQNNYNPTGLSFANVLRISSDTTRAITGLAAQYSGDFLLLLNVGSYNITLSNESGSSSAANRFSIGDTVLLAPGHGVVLWYDITSSRWRAVGSVGSSSSPSGNTLSAEVLADAPRGYWKCNDTSGSTITDYSGNGYHLTTVGSPTLADSYLVPTDNDKYLRIRGTGDGAEITSALGTTPPLTANWAFECIVKTEAYTTNHVRVMSFGLNTSETEANNLQASFYFTVTTGNPAVSWEHGGGTDDNVPRAPATTPIAFGASIYAVEKDGTANTVTYFLNGKKFADAQAYANEPSGGTGSIKFCLGYDGNNTQNFCIAHASFYTTLPGAARWWAHAQAAGLAAF